MVRKLISLLSFAIIAMAASAQSDQDIATDEGKTIVFRGVAELGYTAILSHRIQLGEEGTYFNYVKDGGQDVLFPFTRLGLEMESNRKHIFILLYQPLRLETTALLREDTEFYGTVFNGSTGLKSLYNFPFYRFSYMRSLYPERKDMSLAIGLSLQIRNATISFESLDGGKYTDSRGVGPVPALKLRARREWNQRIFAEIEADGMYAPVSYLNGSDNEIVGAILDASSRIGSRILEKGTIYLNLRYLGGGAVGTDTGDVWPGDGYVRNWLHFLIVSSGFTYEF